MHTTSSCSHVSLSSVSQRSSDFVSYLRTYSPRVSYLKVEASLIKISSHVRYHQQAGSRLHTPSPTNPNTMPCSFLFDMYFIHFYMQICSYCINPCFSNRAKWNQVPLYELSREFIILGNSNWITYRYISGSSIGNKTL